MNARTRLAALALALPLALAACGGGGDKDALLEELRQDAADSGAPAELVDCVMTAMEGLSVEELTSIRDDTATAETEEKVTVAMGDCAVPE